MSETIFITIECPKCGATIRDDAIEGGRTQIQCDQCGAVITVTVVVEE